MNFNKVLVLLFSLLLLSAVGGGLSCYLGAKQGGIRNVILISIDTCRADHLSCYGFDRPTTPEIDEIAKQGLLFTNAHAPVPMTLPAHCSMLTGTYPPYHRVRENNEYKLDASNITLAEILKEHGYATGAVVSSFILDQQFGTGQGFDVYDDDFEADEGSAPSNERIGGDVSRRACDFLEKHKDQPFFLFLHYFDPHTDYEPPEPFASSFAADLYSGEIAYADWCIGQVIDKLKELDLHDSALLVIVGDHGESLGEHGETTHEYFIYQSTIRVPFIIRAPGMTQPIEVDRTASLVDVVPTILSYLNLPIPAQVQGEDLSDYGRPGVSFNGTSKETRQVYIESMSSTRFGCNPLLGLVSDYWNYIHANQRELYDLQQDLQQKHNLADKEPQRVRLMESNLQEMLGQLVKVESAESRVVLDAETRRRLESLGYLGGAEAYDSTALDPAKRDAKDMIECHEYSMQALDLVGEKKYDQAREICRRIISQWSDIQDAYLLLMRIGFETDNPGEIIEYGRQYFTLNPEADLARRQVDGALLINRFSNAYRLMEQSALKLEKYDLAVEYCGKFLQLNPEAPNAPVVQNDLAWACFHQGKNDEAFELWGEILKQHPDMAEVYNYRGRAYYQVGNLDGAIENWSRAVQIRPHWPEVRNNINAALGLKRLDQSIMQSTEMLRRNPNNYKLQDQLANLLYDRGRYEQAIEHWREAIRLKPDEPVAYNNLAWALATVDREGLRNPAEAVQLAYQAAELTQFKQANILETLSVAYAASGNFVEAISMAEKALQIALSEGNKILAEKLRQNIVQYKAKRNG